MTIRRTSFSRDPEELATQMDEFARDVREEFDVRPRMQTKKVRERAVFPLALDVLAPRKPDHVFCTEVELVSKPETPEETVGLSWSWLEGRVQIESIAGLAGGTEYDLTFLIIGGDGRVPIGG